MGKRVSIMLLWSNANQPYITWEARPGRGFRVLIISYLLRKTEYLLDNSVMRNEKSKWICHTHICLYNCVCVYLSVTSVCDNVCVYTCMISWRPQVDIKNQRRGHSSSHLLQKTCWSKYITLFKKSNATRLWSIIFMLSWIFIHQMRYP